MVLFIIAEIISWLISSRPSRVMFLQEGKENGNRGFAGAIPETVSLPFHMRNLLRKLVETLLFSRT